MATFRVGVGSFNIKDGAVGFGTEIDGLGNLRVKGVTKTTGSIVSGASTLTRYSGFAADNISQLENITLTSEVGTIGDIVVGVGTSVIISSASTVTVGTVESVSIGTHFSPPTGGIEDRGQDFIEGMMRFNTDLNTMEFYNGNEWRQFTYISDVQNSPSSRGRAVIYQGYQPSYYPDMIDFLQISTRGNTEYFGDQITPAARDRLGCGSEIRGVFGGGITPGNSRLDQMDYITIPSEGNSITFGDLTGGQGHGATCSSSTRGLFGGGYQPSLGNTVDYIQIQTLGNALDFGDLQLATGYGAAGSSQIRGIFCGGSYNAPNDLASDRTEFFTFASKGNGTDFGGLTNGRFRPTACGAHLSVFTFGSNSGNSGQVVGIDQTNSISLGNSVNFGDLAYDLAMGFAAGNNTRVVVGGGQGGGTSPAFQQNNIQFITIATRGNSVDFGEVTLPTVFPNATSDSHGGLGGY